VPFLEPVGRCVCELVKLYQAHSQTTLYRVHATRSIADDAGKTDATLTPGGHRFGFRYSLSRHCNARMGLPALPSCYIVVSFLLLDITVFCKPMNTCEVTRQLLCRLAFNFHNIGLSEIELRLVVGLNFTVTGLSWVDCNLELNSGLSLWDERQWVVVYGSQWQASHFLRRQRNSLPLMFHVHTEWPSGEVCPEK